VLTDMAGRDPALVVLRFRRNFGQTAAIQAGLDEARGEVVVLMDADLQNDPRDIPMMLAHLEEGHDLVAGWRADRPLLLLGILLIVVGVQLVSLGLVADLLARTYHEAQAKPPYHVRTVIRGAGHHPAVAAEREAVAVLSPSVSRPGAS